MNRRGFLGTIAAAVSCAFAPKRTVHGLFNPEERIHEQYLAAPLCIEFTWEPTDFVQIVPESSWMGARTGRIDFLPATKPSA